MKRFLFATAIALILAGTAELRAGSFANCGSQAEESLVSALSQQASGLRPEVLRLALDASSCAAQRGLVHRQDVLSVIDYSISSSQQRLFVFDLEARKLLFQELVAHGKNSGGDMASYFSNGSGSLATSLGLFVTADTYFGSNGYSLRLDGLEEGVNDSARNRLIVMHGAHYVSRESIRALGRLGRSSGCPAVRPEIAKELIDTVRGGTALFAYYPDHTWLAHSDFLPHSGRQTASSSVAVASR